MGLPTTGVASFVVRQGLVMQLSQLRPKEILDLVASVSGAQSYDSKREVSQKMLAAAEKKRESAEAHIEEVAERLEQLGSEQSELKRLLTLEAKKYSTEHVLFTRRHQAAKAELDAQRESLEGAEVTAKEGLAVLTETETRLASGQDEMTAVQERLASCRVLTETLQADLRHRRDEADRQAAQVERAEADASEQADALVQRGQRERERQTVGAAARKKLAKVEAQLKRQRDILSKRQTATAKCTATLTALSYSDSAEGGAEGGLGARAQALRQSAADRSALVSDTLSGRAQAIEADLEKAQAEAAQAKAAKADADKAFKAKQAETRGADQDLTKARGNQKRAYGKFTQDKARQEERAAAVSKAENNLYGQAPPPLHSAIRLVRHVASTHKVQGVVGAVAEHVSCDPRLYTAVEAYTGNQLYNVIVQSAEVAAELVSLIHSAMARPTPEVQAILGGVAPGRISFLPLDDLHPSDPPTGFDKKDAVGLLDKLSCSARVLPAVRHLFGQCLLARDIPKAARVTEAHQCDAVTLEGDVVRSQGTVTGGYRYQASKRMKAAERLGEERAKLDAAGAAVSEGAVNVKKLDQEATAAAQHHQRLDTELGLCREARDRAGRAYSECQAQVHALEGRLSDMQEDIAGATAEATRLVTRADALEQVLLGEGEVDVGQARAALDAATDAEEQSMAKVEGLEGDRALCLAQIRRVEAEAEGGPGLSQSQGSAGPSGMTQDHLAVLKERAAALKGAADQAAQALGAADDEADRAQVEKDRLDRELRHLRTLRDEQSDTAERASNRAASIQAALNQASLHVTQAEESLQALGVQGPDLSAKEAETLSNLSNRDLVSRIAGYNRNISKLTHVNRKAQDLVGHFEGQRKALYRQRAEVAQGEGAIQDLMGDLDTRRAEALVSAVDRVRAQFSRVFETIAGVPGSLVPVRAGVPTESLGEADGLVPDVSFPGLERGQGERARDSYLARLSGGQRTVVALSLVLALQATSPSPFLLLDEVDAALDEQYRVTLAAELDRMCEESHIQIIATSFRPEMVRAATNRYLVQQHGQASRISVVDEADALRLVTTDPEAGAGGDIEAEDEDED
ncbi:structural maintenance of chromosomes protein 3 [Kipferlia bialata]|uniref:Structural maintenance of chromosomes protein 3 n=1 Tax=Kipferlia bialata TaxID=797122 RepID=A0A9K3CQX5_9EUKA|nr:structural maintenance of chromosomes protein 3 [Kipferlia bialata]|eukprot:g1687.t1